MLSLNNKRILLIAPSFFEYYKMIKHELERSGASVWCINDDFLSNSFLYKYIYRRLAYLKFHYADKQYLSKLHDIPTNLDYIFIIRGSAISTKVLEELKEKNPSAKLIMYQWDSVRNNQNALVLARYCDENITFDPEDASTYGWKYRPLFYYDTSDERCEKEYDFAFVGTLYYKRAEVLKKIKSFCNKEGYKLFDYLYVNKWEYYIHRFLMRDKRYCVLNKDEVHFMALSKKELSDIYRKSKILVDYTAETQTGLTMRTIESIGFKCKLLTNSNIIKTTDIYNETNVHIYDLEEFKIDSSFINNGYKELDKDILNYYSVQGWIKSIFGDTAHED